MSSPEAALSPLLFVLKGLSMSDDFARDHIKRHIFKEHAYSLEYVYCSIMFILNVCLEMTRTLLLRMIT